MVLVRCSVCEKPFMQETDRLAGLTMICSLDCFEKACVTGVGADVETHMKPRWSTADPKPGRIKKFEHQMTSFRSAGEKKLSTLLQKLKLPWAYEPFVFYMEIKKKTEGYVPDFWVPGALLEFKGQWTLEGRRKVEKLRDTFPWIRLIVMDDQMISFLRREANARVRSDRR